LENCSKRRAERHVISRRIEVGSFTLAEHQRFLAAHTGEIAISKQRQQQAFEPEQQRWREDSASAETDEGEIFPDGTTIVCAPSGASV
jgi:urea carboxylase